MVKIPNYLVIIAVISIATIAVGTFTLVSNDKAITPVLDSQDADFTEDEIITLDLHPKIVEQLVDNLIEVYDKNGLEKLRNANYIGILSGIDQGIRYLYIIDPVTNEIIGQHDSAPKTYRVIPEGFAEAGAIWVNLHNDEQGDISTLIEKHYLKLHDGLIFTSGYGVDYRGLPVN
jgi:hypothetical protein